MSARLGEVKLQKESLEKFCSPVLGEVRALGLEGGERGVEGRAVEGRSRGHGRGQEGVLRKREQRAGPGRVSELRTWRGADLVRGWGDDAQTLRVIMANKDGEMISVHNLSLVFLQRSFSGSLA